MIGTEHSTASVRHSLRVASIAAGALVMLLGVAVMLGWHVGSQWLIQIRDTFVPMQYNSALAFVLSGGGLLLLALDRPRWALGAGVAVAVLGALTLSQDIICIWAPQFGLGIDQLLMRQDLPDGDAPGRMAPNTAICFLLTGCCLALRPTQSWFRGHAATVALTASMALGLSMVALSGYYVQLPPAYGWGDWTEMSIHSSIGFALLSAGLLLLQWRRDIGRETWVPTWMPLTIAVAGLTATLCFWQALNAEGARLHAELPELTNVTRVTNLATLILVIGTVASIALAAVAHLSQKAYSRAWQLNQANLSLWAEIETRKEAERALAAHRDNLEHAVAERTEQLEHARREAESANRAKSEFLSHMSHELRTPLNGILGYAQILRRQGSLPAESLQQLQAISDCGDHLLSLINDVLDLAKIEAQKVEVDLAPVQLASLVRGVTGVVREKAEKKGLKLIVQQAEDVPPGIVTDGAKLRQILINLLGNAIKFTQRGAVWLRVTSTGDTLRWEVADTGIGMSPQELSQIFNPFKQVEAGKAAGGTGLGLAITKNLADLLEACVSVESAPGQGSTFTVTMPLVAATVDDLAASSDADLAGVQGVILAPGQSFTVLIADDREVNRQVLAGMLRPLGFQLLEAADGDEALELLHAHPEVALVLMDVRMPRVSGTSAVQQIRSDRQLSTLKVIAVTASVYPEFRQQMLAAGFDDFLAKPLRWDELLGKLQKHLSVQWQPLDAAPLVETLPLDPQQAAGPSTAQLAHSQLQQLRSALRIKNVTAIKALAAQLEQSPDSQELGRQIRELARQFAFDQLAALVQQWEQSDDNR